MELIQANDHDNQADVKGIDLEDCRLYRIRGYLDTNGRLREGSKDTYLVMRVENQLLFLDCSGLCADDPADYTFLNPVKLDWAKVKIDISEATP